MKYQRFTPSDGKNKGIRKSDFVTKTLFLYSSFLIINFFVILKITKKFKQGYPHRMRFQRRVYSNRLSSTIYRWQRRNGLVIHDAK